MKVKLIENKNPYILDRLDDSKKLVALTTKNSQFIEAVIKLDSNYGIDDDINNGPSGNFRGSTAYWFNQLKNFKDSFDVCIRNLVTSIDVFNSTHLDAAKDGRKIIADRIIEKCKNFNGLISAMSENFTPDNKNHIISILTKPIKDYKGGERYGLSFATKFCSYVCHYLELEDKYSKYDSVVSNVLADYVKIYLNESVRTSKFKKDNYLNKCDRLSLNLEVYELYNSYIGKILEQLKKEEIVLSRDEFDHILWYSNKGR